MSYELWLYSGRYSGFEIGYGAGVARLSRPKEPGKNNLGVYQLPMFLAGLVPAVLGLATIGGAARPEGLRRRIIGMC